MLYRMLKGGGCVRSDHIESGVLSQMSQESLLYPQHMGQRNSSNTNLEGPQNTLGTVAALNYAPLWTREEGEAPYKIKKGACSWEEIYAALCHRSIEAQC